MKKIITLFAFLSIAYVAQTEPVEGLNTEIRITDML